MQSTTMVADDDTLPQVSENPEARKGSRYLWPVEFVAAILMVGIVALLFLGVVTRYFLNLPLIWVEEAASLCFLWLAMLGAAIAIDRNEHLRLTLVVHLLPKRLQDFVEALALAVVAAFLIALFPSAYEYAVAEWAITTPALQIPGTIRAAAIPFGMGLMLLLVAVYALQTCKLWHLLASAAILAVIGGLLWLTSPALISMGSSSLFLFLLAFVSLALAAGVPIAFCFGIGTLTYLAFGTHVPVFVMIGRIDEGMSGVVLMAVPIFVLLGCILDATGMGKAIVSFLSAILGHVRGGMSYVLLGSLFVVSGISGSKVSDMATVAPALFPEMKRRGNKPPQMVALLATGAAMADTVPPSIILIVMGSVAGISIAALFTTGIVIALVLLMVLAILARFLARTDDMTGISKAPRSVVKQTLVVAIPILILPFMIRFAVTDGIATATEVSTVAVLYALIVGATLYGGLSGRKLYEILVETSALTGAILLILGTALAMAWAITQAGVAHQLARMMSDLPGGWISFMALSIVMFIVLGCVLEGLPAIVLVSPLVFPISRQLGIHDVHYAMVMITAMNIGLMTPPVGIGFYLACRIGDGRPDEAIKAIWPFLGALLVGCLIIAFLPWISTFLL
ncbi:TRAP transporter large permease [Rhodobium gokarnense]|uniref:Tripartite ATP-independent transporter DctM subunit n=1 Tax=Rhodobium gokarnense TaxID=364296 RepID=A0ABT3HFH6_9HYPH|nr:tripartite ATP-independent transporter DctM subunit [Rhodobium gokarnense]